jgi:hypothetical protein
VAAAARRVESPGAFVIIDQSRRRDRGNRSTRSRAIQPRRAPPPCFRGSLSGSCTKCFPGTVFRYPLRAVAAWPGEKGPSLLLLRPAALMGFSSHPSQACSRREVNRHLCRSRPTCPFDRDRCPSRFIFVGWISPSIARETIRRLIAIWTSGLGPPGDPYAAPAVRTRELQPLGRRSCLGLCLLQGCGHTLVHPRGLDPAWIVNLRELATSAFDRRRFACVRSPRRSAVTIDRCSRPVLAVSTALALPIRSWA